MKNTYKILAILLMALFVANKNYAQQLGVYEFNGSSTGDNQLNTVTGQPANATFSPMIRVGVTWNTGGNVFNSKGFQNGAVINTNQYIEFTITANAGYVLNLTQISFATQRSGTGPQNARIAHNFSGNFTTDFQDYVPPTTLAATAWNFTDITTADGGAVKFRFYGWNAAATGTFRLENVQLNGTVTAATPLPVEMIFFNGKKLQKKIQLKWSTATEINNSHFDIERSTDGKEFEILGQEKGNGTSRQIMNYQFTDLSPISGINYYRLKQVDFNGNYEYSKTIAVDAAEEKSNASIVSVNDNESVVVYNGKDTKVHMTIYDISGRTIYKKEEIMLSEGFNELNFSEVQFKTGMYIIHINNDHDLFLVKKFIR